MGRQVRQRVQTRLAWLGINVSDLADILGIHRSNLSRDLAMEEVPRSKIDRICTVLDLDPSTLLADESDLEPGILLAPHPARRVVVKTRAERVQQIRDWFNGNAATESQ